MVREVPIPVEQGSRVRNLGAANLGQALGVRSLAEAYWHLDVTRTDLKSP